MKKALIFFLAIYLCIALSNHTNAQNYYYAPEGKAFLEISTKQILVKFKHGISFEKQRRFFFEEKNFAPLSREMILPRSVVVIAILQNVSEAAEVGTILKRLNLREEVVYANPFLMHKDGTAHGITSQALVRLKSPSDYSLLETAVKAKGAKIKERNQFDPLLFLLEVNDKAGINALELANQLQETGLFEYAEPDFLRITKRMSTNDPLVDDQWSLNNDGVNTSQYGGVAGADMKVFNAWNTTTGLSTIKVAIIDDGVDLNHPDLADNLLPGYDATGQGSNGAPQGDDAHGTACAGIVAMVGNNNIGGAGVAYSCKIVPVRIGYGQGDSFISATSWLSDGITWAWQLGGADILSNSWKTGASSNTINDAIDNAISSGRNGLGSPVLFAAGNDNGPISYPASYPPTISVIAMSMCNERKNPNSCDDESWWGSNFGYGADVAAPGVKITTTDISGTSGSSLGDYTSTFNGTSSACPNAAGVMALILSACPGLTEQSARAVLESTCDKVGGYTFNACVPEQPNGTWSEELGYGRVNAEAALEICNEPVTQTPNFLWAKRMGGTDFDSGTSIAVDANGNVYTTGSFTGTADFDPGSGTYNLTAVGDNNIFVSKLDASGNFVWAKRMGGISFYAIGDQGPSIAVDVAGNVYITGYFKGTADFDPGTGTYNLTSAGSFDIFVSKLDASGNFVWAKQMGGVNDDIGQSIAVDATGNVYTTGYFEGIADFDPGPGTLNLAAAHYLGAFASKLDASGNLVWAKQLGGKAEISGAIGHSITVDANGSVYTTGYFNFTDDFDPGPETFNLTAAGFTDIFVSKLDASGNFVWAKGMGGTDLDYGFSIAVDATGNVYTTGSFKGPADFDPGPEIYSLTGFGFTDIFISKLDASGNFVWAKQIGGVSGERGQTITADATGNVYTIGYFASTADFDPGPETFNLAPSNGNIFISKLDGSGNFIWAKQMGDGRGDQGHSISIDNNGNIYSTGDFNGTGDFDPGSGTYNLTSAGHSDIFVSKFSQASPCTASPIITCPADISVFNDPGDCGANVFFSVSVTGDCPGVSVSCSSTSGDFFPVGVTTVNCTATGTACNTAGCSFEVTVEDNEAPNALCQDVSVTLDDLGNAGIVTADADAGSTDNCDVPLLSLSQSAFTCADVGIVTVTLTVTDLAGNASACTSTITVLDIDTDGDGINNCEDNCPFDTNANQQDSDGDGVGNKCDLCPNADDLEDTDLDGIPDCLDGCPFEADPGQLDTDGDQVGDACDNCPNDRNGNQKDTDGDGIGNKCDNCKHEYNPDQTDTDSDGKGDACDNTSLVAANSGASKENETQAEQLNPLSNSIPEDAEQGELIIFPNPFSTQVTIRFHLPEAGQAFLEIFSIKGQRVRTLDVGLLDAGTHERRWYGRADDGQALAAGIYLVRLRTNNTVLTKKVCLLR